MRVGIIIGRIGGVDGVALETEKWIDVLERLGHEVYLIAGEIHNQFKNATLYPELNFHHPLNIREQDDAYYFQNVEEEKLLSRINKEANRIEKRLLKWVQDNKIDSLIAQNNLALPCHIRMGLAIKNLLEKTSIPCVAHNHDFYWERGDRYATKFDSIKAIMEECFPPRLPNLKHVVINKYAQNTLKDRFGIESTIVPNVMDFNVEYGQSDDYNKSVATDIGFNQNDILLFQITRIVRRKGIETAIDLIKKIDDERVKLVITGTELDDKDSGYYGELVDQVEEFKLNDRVLFAGNKFYSQRYIDKVGTKKIYNLSDAYNASTACTYFSTYEGFGNAFVECVLAKKPIFVNNYEPVYWPDIGSKGFQTVQIEDNKLTSAAINDIYTIITAPQKCQEVAEHNFELGKKYFSYEVLEELLSNLFTSQESNERRKKA